MQLNRLFKLSLFIFSFYIISFLNVYAQEVVAEFGKYDITLDEFEHAYAKNVGGWENAMKQDISDYKNFLDLYVKFRMKLRDAHVRAYNRDPDLMNELKDYQKQVGVSYIIEKKINEPGIKQLYDRRKEEFRVSHIMIRPDSTGEEAAKEKAQAILDSIKNGASFEEMAAKYSDDKFSAVNGGDIYYITAGLLPYEFEDALYTLKAGEVYPGIVKTRFGYHLIKVTVRQHRYPKIKASHILITYQNAEGKIDSAAAKATADSILAELKAGASFEEMAEKYSDDTGTKDKGGDLGYFERRMMVKEFDEAAFNMDIGEISNVIQSNFGYHIIKLTDKMDTQPFESEVENLKTIFNKQRYQHEHDALIDSLKKKYNFAIDENVLKLFIDNSDSLRFGMVHPKFDEIADNVLFTYADKDITIGNFLDMATHNSKVTGKQMDKEAEVRNAINVLAEDMLLEEEAMNLDKTDPEFAQLMDDYRDGIFIFKIQEEEVWNKVKMDSADVYNYWNENKEKYSWPERISFSEIFSTKDSLINKYYDMLNNGAAFDSIAALYTERIAKKKDKGYYELKDVDFNDFYIEANKISDVGTYTKPEVFAGGYAIFKLNDRQPARLKTYEEAKAEVSGEYQEMLSKKLENDYITSLENRYKPQIYYDKLEDAFKQETDN
ncbi:MAG: peptidylprolyl isomerase [Ignavibacteriaceae bacterium]|nr:peptidylprolyl isomerase [Ignavibacteriaceae bacterium]MCW8822996.1 peptidylprolyl isomerase [Ignavibacteriaceae bacterium]